MHTNYSAPFNDYQVMVPPVKLMLLLYGSRFFTSGALAHERKIGSNVGTTLLHLSH